MPSVILPCTETSCTPFAMRCHKHAALLQQLGLFKHPMSTYAAANHQVLPSRAIAAAAAVAPTHLTAHLPISHHMLLTCPCSMRTAAVLSPRPGNLQLDTCSPEPSTGALAAATHAGTSYHTGLQEETQDTNSQSASTLNTTNHCSIQSLAQSELLITQQPTGVEL